METTNKITAIKISPFKVNSKQDVAELLVKMICVLKNLKLSKTESYVLSHFMCEGYNEVAKDKLLQTKVMKNRFALANMLCKLRSKSVLKKDGFKEQLADDFNYLITDKLLFSVMLDNT